MVDLADLWQEGAEHGIGGLRACAAHIITSVMDASDDTYHNEGDGRAGPGQELVVVDDVGQDRVRQKLKV